MLDSNNAQNLDVAPLVNKKGSYGDFAEGNIALSGEVSE